MNPKKLSAATALGVLAALAGAPSALANGAVDVPRLPIPEIPFPANTIEHRVVEHCSSGTGWYAQTSNQGCLVAHSYITSDRDHEVWRDGSGALVAENATVDRTIFSWTARGNVLNVGKAKRPVSNITFEAEGAMNREAVARGWYRVDRNETRGGRAGVVLVETAASPKDNAQSEIFVDPTTYATLERSLHAVIPANPRGLTGELDATDKLVSVEQLPRTPENEALLAMSDHSGVAVKQVEGEDEVIAGAARKAGLKAKTRAQIAKKAKAQGAKKKPAKRAATRTGRRS